MSYSSYHAESLFMYYSHELENKPADIDYCLLPKPVCPSLECLTHVIPEPLPQTESLSAILPESVTFLEQTPETPAFSDHFISVLVHFSIQTTSIYLRNLSLKSFTDRQIKSS